jgi:hypothetical protein
MKSYLVTEKGLAKPPPEPALRRRKVHNGRRVGTHLPPELYVVFKAYVARTGRTGEQVIVQAIEQLTGQSQDPPQPTRGHV